MQSLTIEGTEIRAVSPEGASASMPLADFLQKAGCRPALSRSAILPDGVKAVLSRGAIEIWIHESPPQVRRFNWIREDSPVPFGEGATYRSVRIALPYLITFAVFAPGRRGKLTLSGSNECFFANKPLGSWSDELHYPALLNCSKFDPQDGKPLSWICTQFLERSFDAEPDTSSRQRLAFGALLHCLLETGFNYSSEHHEANSWYSESRSVDLRIATVDAWEKATGENGLFAIEVPWLPTGLNLGQITDRIFGIHQATAPDFGNAEALAQIVFKYRKPRAKGSEATLDNAIAEMMQLSFDMMP